MDGNPVGWFEIPVTDMARAQAFYQGVLEIRLELHELGPATMAWFPARPGAPGAAGSLVQGQSYVPSHEGSMVYLEVTDVEARLARVTKFGGRILNPKTAIGRYGFVGHFEDSEGNRVAFHQAP